MTYWDNSLLIGVPQIDEQHQMLVKALDTLVDDCARGKWPDTIEKTLNMVIEYTKEHFADEEKLQVEIGYPEFEAHKKIHEDLILVVSAFSDELRDNGRTIELFGKISKTLINWVIHHIGEEDRKIGVYIQSKN